MRRKNQLYECEIKSKALSDEGKGSFVCYFSGGNKKTILMNIKKLYPQYTQKEDKPIVNITPMKMKEYNQRVETNIIEHRRRIVQGTTTRLAEAENEVMGN